MTKCTKLVLDYWAATAMLIMLSPKDSQDNILWFKMYRAVGDIGMPEDYIDDLDSLWDSCENGDGDFQRFEDAVVAIFG